MKNVLENLERTYAFDNKDDVRSAFIIGLYYHMLPEWMLGDSLTRAYSWEAPEADFVFNVIAETPTSWHDGYRQLREMGWKRTFAERKGGLITYLLETDDCEAGGKEVPEWAQKLRIRYRVTLPTCRQVQVGTQEVPVFETVCDDIQEPDDEIDRQPTDPQADDDETAPGSRFNEPTSVEIEEESEGE